MTTPTFDNIFSLFYTLYRAEAAVPVSGDDEYIIAMRFANEAVARWATYEGTYWKELFDTALNDGSATTTVITGTTAYAGPDNFQEAGGFIRIKDTGGNTVRTYPIIQPQEAQFRGDNAQYAYFTGTPSSEITLNLNPAPDSSINGFSLDYVYYKKPTEFEDGDSVTELANTEYICHRMLAQRFRASRNPYYTDALRDSEDALKNMKMDNDSGSWADPWKLADNSGAQFGLSYGAGSIFQ